MNAAPRTDAPQDAPNDLGMVHAQYKLPLLVRDFGLFVQVSFDGKAPAVMKVDTGSPSSAIDTERARERGLRAGAAQAKVGDVELGARRVAVTPWPNADQTYDGMPGPVAGVVGNDFFDGFAVGIDYRAEELWLYPNGQADQPDRLEAPERVGAPFAVPMTKAGGYLVVRCGFYAGSDEDCLFDTGAILSMAFDDYLRGAPALDPHTIPMFTVDSNGRPMTAAYRRAPLVRTGALSVAGDAISAFESFPLVTSVAQYIDRKLVGLVGMATTLGHFVAIDYARDRLLFYPDPQGPPARKSPFVGYGLVLTSTETGELAVGAVVPGSHAEKAGALAKDLVRTIDGAPLAEANIEVTTAAIIAGEPAQKRRFGLSRNGAALEIDIEAEDLLPPP